jgi:hypothetical protein
MPKIKKEPNTSSSSSSSKSKSKSSDVALSNTDTASSSTDIFVKTEPLEGIAEINWRKSNPFLINYIRMFLSLLRLKKYIREKFSL